MKKNILVTLIAFLPASLLAQKAVEIAAPISSVKVCLNAAQIVHTQKITVKPGKNKMVFTGLAMNIDKNHIALRNFGNSELLSLALVRVSDTTNVFSLPADVLEIIRKSKDSVLVYEKNIEKTVYEIKGLELELGMLVKNDDIIANGKSMTVAELKATTEYYRTRYSEVNLEIAHKKRALASMRKNKVRVLKSAFDITSSQENSMTIHVITAELNNMGAEYSSDAELVYVAQGAGWIPVYDMYAANNKTLDIKYRAKILNNTGIDWNNMNITLSTADPTAYYAAPDLEPFYVNSYGGRRYSSYNKSNYDYQDEQQQQQQKLDLNEEEIFIPEREISFKLAKPYTLKAGLTPFFVDVTSYNLTPAFSYRTAPKKEEQVYSIAKIKEWEILNLVDGEASIYNNGAFLGKCYIKPSAIEDDLELPLGVVDNIFVKYKLVSEVSNKRGFSGGITATFTYEIKLKNSTGSPIAIEVIDQVPVSESSSVKTDILEVTEGVDKDPISGKLSWPLELSNNSEKTLNLKYSVSYPRGYNFGGYGKHRAVRAKF